MAIQGILTPSVPQPSHTESLLLGCRWAEVTEKPTNGSDDWPWGRCGDYIYYGKQKAGDFLKTWNMETSKRKAAPCMGSLGKL